MNSNFDFIINNEDGSEFEMLYKCCKHAEYNLGKFNEMASVSARMGLEFIVKWIYASEDWNTKRFDGNDIDLYDLIRDQRFKDLVNDYRLVRKADNIRVVGNKSVHELCHVSDEKAENLIYELHYFIGEMFVEMEIVKSYDDFDWELLDKMQQQKSYLSRYNQQNKQLPNCAEDGPKRPMKSILKRISNWIKRKDKKTDDIDYCVDYCVDYWRDVFDEDNIINKKQAYEVDEISPSPELVAKYRDRIKKLVK